MRLPLGREEEEPSPGRQGEGHGRGEEPGAAAPRNLPAYGARNAQKVAAGTGEALPGPAACCRRSVAPYNRCRAGKWVASREGVGGGRSTARADGTTEPAAREGPLLRSCVTHREGPVSASDGYNHQAGQSPRTATGALPCGQGRQPNAGGEERR